MVHHGSSGGIITSDDSSGSEKFEGEINDMLKEIQANVQREQQEYSATPFQKVQPPPKKEPEAVNAAAFMNP